jgi:hypothetical protein
MDALVERRRLDADGAGHPLHRQPVQPVDLDDATTSDDDLGERGPGGGGNSNLHLNATIISYHGYVC